MQIMLLYQLGIGIYGILIRFFSLFNTKAKIWIKGRSNIFENLKNCNFQNHKKIIWFHCASLGEFEQARPLIEFFKKNHQDIKILLTFFSPSGYEIRKNYALADWIFYLPLDTKANAHQFVEIINPRLVIFVKYEFWYNYINQLHKLKIPTYSIAAIFRKNQYYFNLVGNILPNPLYLFTHIFVQNNKSKQLLKSLKIEATIAGDTRFDRVVDIAKSNNLKPEIEIFKSNKKLLIIGSAWPEDIKIIFNRENEIITKIKVLIAPHNIDGASINSIINLLPKDVGYYSKKQFDKPILILDNIGMLNDIYKYADITYIGGAFGKGLHNILEAAIHAKPIVFGPKYTKFQEAIDLIALKGAVSIKDNASLNHILKHWLENSVEAKMAGNANQSYVHENIGAVQKIYNHIKNHI